MQQALTDLGHDLGPSGADGVYGTWTWNAVKQFKTNERLGFEHMGDVGPGSMNRLDELFPPTDTPPVTPSQPVGLVGSATCAGVIASEEAGGDNVTGDSTGDVTGPVERLAAGAATGGRACPIISDFSGFGRIPPSPDARAVLMSLSLVLAGGMIEVRVDRSKSWLNPYFVPTGNERVPDTARLVRECGQAFQGGEVAPGQAYGAWSTCSTNVSPLEALSPPSCETVIGRELDQRRAEDRDTRLLRHEQYHVKLACALARIGNARIARGIPAARALADIDKEEARLQKLYDHETGHGCNLAAQATWQSAIDTPGGLI